MAEHDFREDGLSYVITPTDVMTGDRNRRMQLYYQLSQSISHAKKIDIIVSFLMESGVKMLLNDLKAALDRGVTLRILTGNYLGITQPSALYLLKYKLGERVDLRFYNENERSFHPKAYIFHYEDRDEIFIGSSNISRSALALRDELAAVIRDPVFVGHVKDVIDYRTMDYYQRRYVETVVERDP